MYAVSQSTGLCGGMIDQSAERAKRPQDPRTSRCDYDDSDAARGAGHLARPDRHDRFSGADKSGCGNRPRLSAYYCAPIKADSSDDQKAYCEGWRVIRKGW